MPMQATLRLQIDALDEAIANLVLERSRISYRLWAAREDAGGARVDLAREREVRDHYGSVIGSDGMDLADAILRISRGPVHTREDSHA